MPGFGKTKPSQRRKKRKTSQRYTEVYYALVVPPMVPEFVDEHITSLDEGGYMFEVNPAHPDAEAVRNKGQTIIQALSKCGFIGVEHVYSGVRPEFPEG